MANEEQLKILKQGWKTWNAWRIENHDIIIDLGKADLSGADLSGADLSGADLSGADLSGADLSGADLSGADLRRINFSMADLREANLNSTILVGVSLNRAILIGAGINMADLRGADLREANLNGADLRGSDLSRSYLSGVDLSRATVFMTQFTDVDLSEVEGLDQMHHHGPSSIGLDTIRLSKGKLPEVFLRGCGLTDFEILTAQLHNPYLTDGEFIDLTYKLNAMRSTGVIHFHSCFISYSHQDRAIAEKLYSDLQEGGIRCWFAPEDLKIGEKYRSRIDSAITKHDRLLLIMSEHSLKSGWVEQEVETALANEEADGEPRLFPVRIDEAVMGSKLGWPALVQRTRHIGDFSEWQNEASYKQAFERLKQDLQQNVERNHGE